MSNAIEVSLLTTVISDRSTRTAQRSRIRVANITEDSRYAGPQRRIALIASALSVGHGIETVVIHPRREASRFSGELAVRSVVHRSLGLHRLSRHWRDLIPSLLLFPWEVTRLYFILRTSKFDIVHCNGSWQWKGAIAARLAGLPVIWHLNDTYAPRPVLRIYRTVAKYCARGFIVAGSRVRSYYLSSDLGADKPAWVIQAPVSCAKLERSTPVVKREQENGVRVITLANVNPLKDIETLVYVAFHLRRIAPSKTFDFFIYGGLFDSQRAYIDQIRSLVKELGVTNVHMPGPIDNVGIALAASHIYLCTSHAEASPMAVWEAAAAGLPVVSTDVGDISELNSTWNFACTAPVGDKETLAKALLTLARNPAKRTELGENGRKLAASEFDVSVCAKKHADAYRSLLTQLRSAS